jgi:hypothetical protein
MQQLEPPFSILHGAENYSFVDYVFFLSRYDLYIRWLERLGFLVKENRVGIQFEDYSTAYLSTPFKKVTSSRLLVSFGRKGQFY